MVKSLLFITLVLAIISNIAAKTTAKDFRIHINREYQTAEAKLQNFERRKAQMKMQEEMNRNNTIFKKVTQKLYSILSGYKENSLI